MINHRIISSCSLYEASGNQSKNLTTLFRRKFDQSGAVLIISLIILLLLTLIATTGMQTSTLEEKMAGNLRDKNLAFQAAESSLKAIETSLNNTIPTFSAAGTNGYYSSTSTLPSASSVLTDVFWTSNPIATSTVTGLGNGIATPVYIIQDMGKVADCPGAGTGTLGCKYYRITTRASGGSTNAVAILQSIYLR